MVASATVAQGLPLALSKLGNMSVHTEVVSWGQLKNPGAVAHPYKQESETEANLGYLTRPCLK